MCAIVEDIYGNRISLKPESVELNAQNGYWTNLEASAFGVTNYANTTKGSGWAHRLWSKMVNIFDAVIKVESTIIEEISLSPIGASLISTIQPGR